MKEQKPSRTMIMCKNMYLYLKLTYKTLYTHTCLSWSEFLKFGPVVIKHKVDRSCGVLTFCYSLKLTLKNKR